MKLEKCYRERTQGDQVSSEGSEYKRKLLIEKRKREERKRERRRAYSCLNRMIQGKG